MSHFGTKTMHSHFPLNWHNLTLSWLINSIYILILPDVAKAHKVLAIQPECPDDCAHI